jgi:RND family efflux transporter MFP subunit
VSARSTLEDLEARLRSEQALIAAADAEIRADKGQVRVLEAGLAYLTVAAPIDGTVVREPIRVGESVTLGGNALVELVDFSSLVVETDVPEAKLGMVRLNGPVEIVLDAFPNRRFRGSTLEVGQRVDRSKATVAVRMRFVDPAAGVLPDMSARASFLTEELSEETLGQPDKRVVPARAVVERGGRKVIFIVRDGTVDARPVTLGGRMGTSVELLDGPEAGTQVVSSPPATLEEGHRVREKED